MSRRVILLVTSKDLILIVGSLLSLFHSGYAWWPREFPRIEPSRWLQIDEEDSSGGIHVWRTDFENMTKNYFQILDQGRTFVVSSQITSLGFECNASYPVQWVAHIDEAITPEYFSYYLRAQYLRSNPDVFNPRSNVFTATLDFYGEFSVITGNYSCVSAEYPDDVIRSIYVYWQGSNPSNLVLYGKSIDVYSQNGKTVILPCRVTKPDIEVLLYKEISSIQHDYILIRSPYITFDPKVGFKIDLFQYNGAYGRYKCATSEDDEEPLFIVLKKGVRVKDKFEFNNTLTGNATLTFNRTSQEIVCCSNSSRTPKLHTLFCVEPFSCSVRTPQLIKMSNNGKRLKTGSCTSERIYMKDSGLLRCVGDGVDLVRNFYSDLPTQKNNHTSNLCAFSCPINVVFQWSDLKPEDLIEISLNSRKPIYEKTNITVTCDTSYNYFAEGMQWAVRWKNQSLKFFPTPDVKQTFGDLYESSQSSFQSIRLEMLTEMEEVLCFAPVWNSTDWINKTLSLDVQETHPPKFSNPDTEVIQWKLNDTEQILECKVKGAPAPTIRWKKNNRTVLPESNIAQRKQNGTAILTIRRVSHDTQGEYKCVAANLAGSVEKSFFIYVEDPSGLLGPLGITLLTLMILTLVGALGFLIWKMNLQKSMIDHLAGIVFRDVGGTPRTNPTDISSAAAASVTSVVSANGNSARNPFPSAQ